MLTTSFTLLERLRHEDNRAAWDRFAQLYGPLLYRWARRLGLQPPDADDLVQDVFAILVRRLPGFQPDPQHSFRGWLWTVLRNEYRQRRKRQRHHPAVNGLADDTPLPDNVEEWADAEDRTFLLGRALELIRHDFEPRTWQAFWEVVVRQRPVAEVAAELGMQANALYAAKFRVLARLREEWAGLLD